jgi:metal-responsive CopG/Arc/MetJ family transcriptional regulator
MARINITIPDGLLEDVDRTAESIGTSRSAFLQEAGACYIAQIAEEHKREQRTRDIDAAIAHARTVGADVTPGFDAVAQIRRDRERDGA